MPLLNFILDALAIILDILFFLVWLICYPFYLLYIHIKEAIRRFKSQI